MQDNSEQLLNRATLSIQRRDAEILLAAAWQRPRSQILAFAPEPVPPTSRRDSPTPANGARAANRWPICWGGANSGRWTSR
jgi:hypothetical protein